MSLVHICVRNYSTRVATIDAVNLKNATWGRERASWNEDYIGLITKLRISPNTEVRSSITTVQARQSYSVGCDLVFDEASGERYESVRFVIGATAEAGNQWSPFGGAHSISQRLIVNVSTPLSWYGSYLVSLTVLDARRAPSSRLGGLVRAFGRLLES